MARLDGASRSETSPAVRALLGITLGLLCTCATCFGSSGGGDDDEEDDDVFVFDSNTSDAFAVFVLDDVIVAPRADAGERGGPAAGAQAAAPGAGAGGGGADPPDVPRLAPGEGLVLVFSAPVDAASAPGALQVTSGDGAPLPASIEVDGTRVTVRPRPADGATRARIVLGGTLRGAQGRPLAPRADGLGTRAAPIELGLAAPAPRPAARGLRIEQRLRITREGDPHLVERIDVVEVAGAPRGRPAAPPSAHQGP